MAASFPLTWPHHIERSRSREAGKFKASLPGALSNVETSIRLFAKDSDRTVSGLVISTNYALSDRRPSDPGVAVWFVWDGMQVCIPVDRYTTIEANLQAIHHVIEARRVELRHGTLALVRATFQGFLALPSPSAARAWREVLGLTGEPNPTRDQVEHQFKLKARKAHPDHGGNNTAMAELNAARGQALNEIGQ